MGLDVLIWLKEIASMALPSGKSGQHLQLYKVPHNMQKRLSGVNKTKVPFLFGLGHTVDLVSACPSCANCRSFVSVESYLS